MKYDKRQKTKAETAGFTLVEIVAVLVLLGILSAVAVPKFFDLSSDAEKKAAEAALMEAQVRINAGYSKAVYAGKSCEDAVEGVSSLVKIGDGGKNIINGYTLTLQDGDQLKEAPGSYVTLTKSGKSFDSSTFGNLKQIFKPTCDKTAGDTSVDNGLVCPDGSGGNSGGNTDNPSCPEAKCSVQLTCVNNKVNYSCSCTGNGSCEPPSETVELTCSTSAGGNGSGDAYEWGEDDLPCQGLVCPKGLVIKSGNDYYYITKDWAYFSSDELANPKKYKIEDLQAYGHNNMLVKMNRSKKIECNGECKPNVLEIGDIYFDANGKWYGTGWTSIKDAYQQPQNYWVELMFLHASKFPGYE